MNLFIDTEFNGFGGELLSLAVCDEYGRSWYEAITVADLQPHPWVAANVLPVLMKRPIRRGLAQRQLQAWLMAYDRIHVIADWPEDIAHFCQFLITGPGERLNTPPLTLEVRRDIDSSGSRIPHNALADAEAIRRAHLTLLRT